MKTPHAILIGLSLIAAAIFFKDMPVRSAHASLHDELKGFSCISRKFTISDTGLCFVLTDNKLIGVYPNSKDGLNVKYAWDLKSGKPLKKGTPLK